MIARTGVLVASLVAVVLFAGCTHEVAKQDQVVLEGFVFTPNEVQVEAGKAVTWTNEVDTQHTVTADDGSWDSGNLGPGETFEHTFDEPGEYSYHCVPHLEQGMKGTIIVTEA